MHRLASSLRAVSHMGRGHQLIGVWPESPASAKIKTAKISSEESARFSAKICTSENFPLYGILPNFLSSLHIFISSVTLHCISDISIYCHFQSSPLPSHFVAFVGEEGHLVTARADCTVVKVWPPPPQDSTIITSPEAHIPLTGQIQA